MVRLDLTKKEIPDLPGVYFFIGKNKEILYIGKASSLSDRVKSYFNPDLVMTRGALIVKMVNDAVDLKFEVTDSVLEAIILENNLIKKYLPKANTKEKDDKSFNHVIITKEKYPKVVFERSKNIGKTILNNQIKYDFGPYPHGSQLKEALQLVRKIFPFRDDKCKPAEIEILKGKKPKACFNYQIGLCPGVCVGAISKSEYAKTINHIRLFFEGKKTILIKTLQKEMNTYAKLQEFEKAQKIKRTLFAINHIQDVSLIKKSIKLDVPMRIEAYDVAHLSGTNMTGAFVVVENGILNKAEYRKFKIKTIEKSNDAGALSEILRRRLAHTEWSLPEIIVVDGNEIQKRTAENILNEILKEGSDKIKVVAVVKDEKHKARAIIGDEKIINKYKNEIILANIEAHRFVLAYHKKLRSNFVL